jgi:hypothetical protein
MLALLASSIVGLGVSGGIGSSYDYLGVRLDLRIWHVAASVGLGVSGLNLDLFGVFGGEASGSYGLRNVQIAPALGLRVFSGNSEGFVAAVNWTGHRYERSYDNANSFDRTARMDTVTLTVGWRFRAWPGWFLEPAVGLGIASLSGHPDPTGTGSPPPFPFEEIYGGSSTFRSALGSSSRSGPHAAPSAAPSRLAFLTRTSAVRYRAFIPDESSNFPC